MEAIPVKNMRTSESPLRIHCQSEYASLKQVILCRPEYMTIKEIINRTQAHFSEENIKPERALAQHTRLIEVLQQQGVHVVLLPAQPHFPEQVFTRDIGFSLGSQLFISRMERALRQGEETILKEWLGKRNLRYTVIYLGNIEGGDVLIDNDTVWIGDSGRTSLTAIRELESHLSSFNVVRLPFPEEYLHLDCIFNVISEDHALIYPPAFQPDDLQKLAQRYHLIEVPENEQFTLGTNVLSLRPGTLVSLPINRETNRRLRAKGYTVIETDISEIIKSGGSFRCITLPLYRED